MEDRDAERGTDAAAAAELAMGEMAGLDAEAIISCSTVAQCSERDHCQAKPESRSRTAHSRVSMYA
jgi:hypothetical protein